MAACWKETVKAFIVFLVFLPPPLLLFTCWSSMGTMETERSAANEQQQPPLAAQPGSSTEGRRDAEHSLFGVVCDVAAVLFVGVLSSRGLFLSGSSESSRSCRKSTSWSSVKTNSQQKCSTSAWVGTFSVFKHFTHPKSVQFKLEAFVSQRRTCWSKRFLSVEIWTDSLEENLSSSKPLDPNQNLQSKIRISVSELSCCVVTGRFQLKHADVGELSCSLLASSQLEITVISHKLSAWWSASHWSGSQVLLRFTGTNTLEKKTAGLTGSGLLLLTTYLCLFIVLVWFEWNTPLASGRGKFPFREPMNWNDPHTHTHTHTHTHAHVLSP